MITIINLIFNSVSFCISVSSREKERTYLLILLILIISEGFEVTELHL